MFGKENKKSKKKESTSKQQETSQNNYKKLKKLSKIELLTIIRQQREENEILQKKYDDDMSALKEKHDKENKVLQDRMKNENETLQAQLELEKTSVREHYEKENEEFKLKIQELEEQLENYEINIRESGSIAEAAFRINCVMEVAQRAADDYVKNIRRMNDELQSEYSVYEVQAKAKAEQIIKEATEQSEKIRQDAKAQTDDIWGSLQSRFASYCNSARDDSQRDLSNVTPFKTRESI